MAARNAFWGQLRTTEGNETLATGFYIGPLARALGLSKAPVPGSSMASEEARIDLIVRCVRQAAWVVE